MLDAVMRKTSVPQSVVWLGALGLLPFFGFCLLAFVASTEFEQTAKTALAAYGAVILSFLGGIHWGALFSGETISDNRATFRLVSGTVPSLIAWVALLLPVSLALYGLAGALIAMLLFDLWASRRGWVPPWYQSLRWPLSIGASAACAIATFA